MKYILEAVGTSRFFSSFKLKQMGLWLAWPVFSDPRTSFYILQIKFSSEYKESNKQNLKKNMLCWCFIPIVLNFLTLCECAFYLHARIYIMCMLCGAEVRRRHWIPWSWNDCKLPCWFWEQNLGLLWSIKCSIFLSNHGCCFYLKSFRNRLYFLKYIMERKIACFFPLLKFYLALQTRILIFRMSI